MEDYYDDTNVKAIYDSMMNRIVNAKQEKEMKKAQSSFKSWLKWYLGTQKVFVDLPFINFK